MKQQINLYQLDEQPEATMLTFMHVVQLSIVFILMLSILTGYKFISYYSYQTELDDLHQQKASLDVELEQAKKKVPAKEEQAILMQQLNALEGDALQMQKMHATLQQLQATATSGFAKHLRALAKHSIAELWLTSFKLSSGGDVVSISGKTTNAKHIPQLIQQLSKFGDFYLRSNPNSSIRDADAAYVLALQALMLNAERKTSLMDIQNNLKNRNQGVDFEKDFLKAFHSSIVNRSLDVTTIKKLPGYIIESDALSNDEMCVEVVKCAKNKQEEGLAKLFPSISANNLTVNIYPLNTLLRKITAAATILTFTNPQGKCLAVMELTNPTSLSKHLFGIHPRVTVQLVHYDDMLTTSASLILAAELAATFSSKVTSVNATFDYDSYDLLELYRRNLRSKKKPS